MLTELYQALYARLSGLGCPVYAHDCVPPDAPFPFVTLEAAPSLSPGGKGTLTLACWHHTSAAHADRLLLADKLCGLFPSGGVLLTLNAGVAVITPSGSAACLSRSTARGESLQLTLRVYPRR